MTDDAERAPSKDAPPEKEQIIQITIMPPDGGPFFPAERLERVEVDGKVGTHPIDYPGASLRDWFAGQVISPQLVQAYGKTPKFLAQRAYEIADAMLEEKRSHDDAEAAKGQSQK